MHGIMCRLSMQITILQALFLNIGAEQAGVNATNNIYTYDTSNKVTKIIQQTWGGSSWVPVSEDVYSYVGSKLVADQYEVWNGLTSSFTSSSEKEYYYDPVTGYKTNETDISLVSGPVNQNEYNYTYSGTGQLLTTTYSTWNGAMCNSLSPATHLILQAI